MGLTFKTSASKTSGSVGYATSRWMGGAAGRALGALRSEAEFLRGLVRSLASRGVAMARLAQAKVVRRESEPKYIAGGRMQLKRMWEAGYTDESR